MTDQINTEVSDLLNKMVNSNPDLARFFTTSQPNYRYFSRRSSKDMYFWTTERVNHGGNPRYVSGIYRYYKTKKEWKALKEAGNAKRKDAKSRARKLYEARA